MSESANNSEPVQFFPPEAPEDRARGDLYALVASLFYAPPDAALLQMLAEADEIVGEEDSVPLAEAWAQLQRVCAASDEESVQQEYDALLIGVGKALVPPYIGAYVDKGRAESLLVDLRAFLAARGLGRQEAVTEPEDHVAALCEVMRHLISVQHAEIEAQREFFARFMDPGGVRLCEAVIAASAANFYTSVAGFAKAFFELERLAFEMN